MKSAAEKMQEILLATEFKVPEIPFINNVDVAIESNPDKLKQALIRQLYSPVRWIETIEKMLQMNVSIIAECGPGKVLTGMNKRIANSAKVIALDNVDDFSNLLTEE